LTDILMPALTDQMREGTIVAWLVENGVTMNAGQELVEIETDKATITHAVDAQGVLEIVAQVGDTVSVGDLIARVGDSPRAPAKPKPAPDTEPVAAARTALEPVAAVHGDGAAAGTGLAWATPLARRFATERGGLDAHDCGELIARGSISAR
jgi:pyruvate/2-oxoglutarate dehydrogenase complex dihydrolipoamide acyltransferase (E2) component